MAKLDRREDFELRDAKAGMRPVVAQLMHTLRGGGLPNPMLAVEQLAYLLLLKHNGRAPWSQFLDSDGEERFSLLRDELFPEVVQKYQLSSRARTVTMRGATFAFPSAELLDFVVEQLVEIPRYQWQCADLLDTALDEVSATSSVGSPRTPATVSDAMIALTEPRAEDLVLDPAAGAGERLLAVIRRSAGVGHRTAGAGGGATQARVRGVDLDATMVRLGAMSLVFHGVGEPDISVNNVLVNPPMPASSSTSFFASPRSGTASIPRCSLRSFSTCRHRALSCCSPSSHSTG